MTLLFPGRSIAQTCPDLSTWTAPSEITFRPTDRLPTPAGPNTGDCDDPVGTDATWCSNNIASLPPTGTTVRDHLFLWFPGKGLAPAESDYVAKLAAFAGYRTLNLAWDNKSMTRADWCDQPGVRGGYCDDGCLFTTGFEMLGGVDDPSTGYLAAPLRSVEARLAMALEHLHKLDVNEDATNDHGWDSFCDYDPYTGHTSIAWSDIEVGGFSAGAQMASFISYIAPSVSPPESIGMIAIDAGADVCGFSDPYTSDPNDDYYPIEYDPDPYGVYEYAPCGDEVNGCPSGNRYVFTHDAGVVGISLAWGDTSLEHVGVASTLLDVDAVIGTFPVPMATNLVSADMATNCPGPEPHNGPHASLGEDVCMPAQHDDPPGTAGGPTTAYMAPAYLTALCSLDSQ